MTTKEAIKLISDALKSYDKNYYFDVEDNENEELDFCIRIEGKKIIIPPENCWDEAKEKHPSLYKIRLSQQCTPYCCGVYEIGDVSFSKSPTKAADEDKHEVFQLLIQYGFLYLLNKLLPGEIRTKRKGKLVIFNSNNKGACIVVNKALEELPNGIFVNVASHTINSSKADITMYIAQ